ncbi:MAG: nucleoside phosphorylase [Chitinophagales bacterium]|nr:nucleoside phosphorylase [Chitinophagales bacterium]
MTVIGASELILNPRGSVYHLDLLPEEIADTIITVGDPARVAKVSKYFDRIDFRQQNREFVTHTGYVGEKQLTVISTGIGTDNIDIVVNELDALVNIDLSNRIVKSKTKSLKFIRIGTSGSLQHDLPVDSFVASRYAIGMDNLMNFYEFSNNVYEKEMLIAFHNHVQEKHIAFTPYVTGCSPFLISKFETEFKQGITVTCPGFYGPQGRMLRGSLIFNDLLSTLSVFSFSGWPITNFEMETSGLYGLARLLGHEALSLSAIVANRIEKQFSNNAEGTIDKLIRVALEKITSD